VTQRPELSVDYPAPLHLALEVAFQSPVNIGGYGAPTFVDRPFRRDGDGWPFIPASSLKGRVRHECERLARALGEEICSGPQPQQMRQAFLRRRRGEGECVVHAIFGSPWKAGRVFPTALTLVKPDALGETDEPPAPTVRYNVSLSRRRRVAEHARLFTTELFLPGVPLTFEGTWDAKLTLKELVLLEAAFGAISALGRGKTGGLGWCDVHVKSSRADGQPVTAEERALGRAAWQSEG
jgi:CRISPR/Cas system CSM-associated protein Csm3 (group 7 of RAMP superfamily)